MLLQNQAGLGSRRFRRVLALLAGMLLTLSAGAGEYIVKKNDTLYGIAKRNGITVSQLAERNGLKKDARIYIGQHLVIPGKTSAPARPVLDSTVQKAIDNAPVTAERWKYVVIHHSAVNTGSVKSTDRFHREERHMEHGMAYHFLVGNGNGMRDGEIGIGRRWREQLNGGHLASETQNTYSLGICLVGNFDKTKPTAKQMESLTALTEALLKRCKLSKNAVKSHQQINVVKTRCPGKKFPLSSFTRGLRGSN